MNTNIDGRRSEIVYDLQIHIKLIKRNFTCKSTLRYLKNIFLIEVLIKYIKDDERKHNCQTYLSERCTILKRCVVHIIQDIKKKQSNNFKSTKEQ